MTFESGASPASLLLADGRSLSFPKPAIMGVLNITPDSFSDGGRFLDPEAAVRHALQMAADGAAVIDMGGESTRPGSQPVPADEQIARLKPVLESLRRQRSDSFPNILISIDTTRASVVEALLPLGVDMVNDVSAGRDDPEMLGMCAEHKLPLVLMHMQGRPRTMQEQPAYADVVGQVRTFLLERMQCAREAGIDARRLMIDPGIGFGKTFEHNWQLLGGLSELTKLGAPVLLGVSRKRFLADCCDASGPALDPATSHLTFWGVMRGVAMVRVHEINANRQAIEVAHRLMSTFDNLPVAHSVREP